jgi:predicted dehydrogenase
LPPATSTTSLCRLHGTAGALKVATNGGRSTLSACLGKDIDENCWREVELRPVRRNARRFADAMLSGQNGDPSFRRAADIHKVIDAVFASAATGAAVAIG